MNIIVRRKQVEAILPMLQEQFNLELEITGSLKTHGYSTHDIDIVVKGLEFKLSYISEKLLPYDEEITYYEIRLDYLIDLAIKLSNSIRQLLNLPSNFRIDVFIEVPEDLKKQSKTGKMPIYLHTWTYSGFYLLKEVFIEIHELNYIIVSVKDNEYELGWI